MADFLYYWKRHKSDLAAGPIYKLNQNSSVMKSISVGDDVWAFGLVAPDAYAIIARFTVAEVGENAPGSHDAVEYGQAYLRSTPSLTNYVVTQVDAEPLIRSLSVRCDGAILGQCFQGGAAVRALDQSDRLALIGSLR